MKRIVLEHCLTLSPAMERLRRRCFYGDGFERNSTDNLDARSSHVVLSTGGNPVAQIRITPDPPFAVNTWSRGAAEMPTGPDVGELSRANVAPEYRGLRLSCLLFCDAFLRLAHMKKRTVVGAVESALLKIPMYKRLGYVKWSSEVTFHEPVGFKIDVQPIVVRDVESHVPNWLAEREETIAFLRRRDIDLIVAAAV